MATVDDIRKPDFRVGYVHAVPQMSFGQYHGKVSTNYAKCSEEVHLYITNSNVIALKAVNTTLKNRTPSELMRSNLPSVYKLRKIVQPCPHTDLLRENATPDQLYRVYNPDTQTFDWDRVECVAEQNAHAILQAKFAKEEEAINQQWYALVFGIFTAVCEMSEKLREAKQSKTLRPCITIVAVPDGIQYRFQCSTIPHVDATKRESNLSSDVEWIRVEVRDLQVTNKRMCSWFICE